MRKTKNKSQLNNEAPAQLINILTKKDESVFKSYLETAHKLKHLETDLLDMSIRMGADIERDFPHIQYRIVLSENKTGLEWSEAEKLNFCTILNTFKSYVKEHEEKASDQTNMRRSQRLRARSRQQVEANDSAENTRKERLESVLKTCDSLQSAAQKKTQERYNNMSMMISTNKKNELNSSFMDSRTFAANTVFASTAMTTSTKSTAEDSISQLQAELELQRFSNQKLEKLLEEESAKLEIEKNNSQKLHIKVKELVQAQETLSRENDEMKAVYNQDIERQQKIRKNESQAAKQTEESLKQQLSLEKDKCHFLLEELNRVKQKNQELENSIPKEGVYIRLEDFENLINQQEQLMKFCPSLLEEFFSGEIDEDIIHQKKIMELKSVLETYLQISKEVEAKKAEIYNLFDNDANDEYGKIRDEVLLLTAIKELSSSEYKVENGDEIKFTEEKEAKLIECQDKLKKMDEERLIRCKELSCSTKMADLFALCVKMNSQIFVINECLIGLIKYQKNLLKLRQEVNALLMEDVPENKQKLQPSIKDSVTEVPNLTQNSLDLQNQLSEQKSENDRLKSVIQEKDQLLEVVMNEFQVMIDGYKAVNTRSEQINANLERQLREAQKALQEQFARNGNKGKENALTNSSTHSGRQLTPQLESKKLSSSSTHTSSRSRVINSFNA